MTVSVLALFVILVFLRVKFASLRPADVAICVTCGVFLAGSQWGAPVRTMAASLTNAASTVVQQVGGG